MKRHDVYFREEAVDDLTDIYRWIHEASRDPVTAQRFTDRIVALCESIGGMPHGGQPRDDFLPGLRTFPFGRRVVVAYLVERETVHITNVFYGGRDYEAFYKRPDDDLTALDPDDEAGER